MCCFFSCHTTSEIILRDAGSVVNRIVDRVSLFPFVFFFQFNDVIYLFTTAFGATRNATTDDIISLINKQINKCIYTHDVVRVRCVHNIALRYGFLRFRDRVVHGESRTCPIIVTLYDEHINIRYDYGHGRLRFRSVGNSVGLPL